jgi:YidC/Oxa1 family membrane protein insertase
MFWSDVVDLLRALIFGVAHVCNGSLGVAVLLVSLTIRLALLPLTLRLARRARDHRRRLDELKPEVERLQRRFANDPQRLWRETSRFYRVRGVKQVDPAGLLGGLAQTPVFVALYSALRNGLGSGNRFLWIGDTALPNVLLNLLVTGTTLAVLASGASGATPRSLQFAMFILMGAMTLWLLSSTSALFALSTGAGSLVGILQNRILARDEKLRQRSS